MSDLRVAGWFFGSVFGMFHGGGCCWCVVGVLSALYAAVDNLVKLLVISVDIVSCPLVFIKLSTGYSLFCE